MSKLTLLALVALTVTAVMAEIQQKESYDLTKAQEYFDDFVKKFDRKYKDDADKQVHYEAFVKNLEKINKMNQGQNSAVFGINKFADYTEEESKQMRGVSLPSQPSP